MNEKQDPFSGLKRKRLPGMHLSTACDGGADLQNTLAAHFFMMLHDKIKHDCLIEKHLQTQKELVEKSVESSKSLEGATLTQVFGILGSISLASEEWSYLDNKDVFVFQLIADTAIEQVQRWIAEGVEKPYELGKLFGEGATRELVQRPEWAIRQFNSSKSQEMRKEPREYVKRLTAEVEAGKQPTSTQ